MLAAGLPTLKVDRRCDACPRCVHVAQLAPFTHPRSTASADLLERSAWTFVQTFAGIRGAHQQPRFGRPQDRRRRCGAVSAQELVDRLDGPRGGRARGYAGGLRDDGAAWMDTRTTTHRIADSMYPRRRGPFSASHNARPSDPVVILPPPRRASIEIWSSGRAHAYATTSSGSKSSLRPVSA